MSGSSRDAMVASTSGGALLVGGLHRARATEVVFMWTARSRLIQADPPLTWRDTSIVISDQRAHEGIVLHGDSGPEGLDPDLAQDGISYSKLLKSYEAYDEIKRLEVRG